MHYWKVLKKTIRKFVNDQPMNYSSSIAFYLIISLPAILIISVSIAGSAYEDQIVRRNMLEQIKLLFGPGSAATIEKVLDNAGVGGSTFLAKVVGIGTLVFSATAVFASLQTGLNNIWGLRAKPNKDVLKFFKDRLLSLAMVISIGFLLLVSLVIDGLVALFSDMLTLWFSTASVYIITSVNILISVGVAIVIFALIFKVMPDAHIKWRDVWVGAVVTTILFILGKYLMGYYLGNSSLGSVYGAAGSLVMLLIWVYYSSIIVLFGAEFTYVYSHELGDEIRPNRFAVAIREYEKDKAIVNKDEPQEGATRREA